LNAWSWIVTEQTLGAGQNSQLVQLCLAGEVGKAGLLAALAQALNFPDWFGHNWDALWESLDDCLAQHHEAGQSLELVFDLSHARSLDESDWQTLVEILEQAREVWPDFVYQVIAPAAGQSEI
jgi:RNAse (barnase) inhibitor barstar